MTWWNRLIEWWHARQRGEVRVAPSHGVRGRIYGKRPGKGGLASEAVAKPEASISARVYRAATGQWEDRGVIGKAEVTHKSEG